MLRSKTRFVLFDAVGTLLHVRPSVAEIYLNVGRRYGSQLTAAEIRQRFDEVFSRLHDGGPTDEDHERERWRAIVSEVLHDVSQAGDGPFEELWTLFSGHQQWGLFADVPEIWSQLQDRGFTLGIASNFDRRLRTLCESFPPLNRAERIFISSEIGFPKPHPEFFRRVAADLHARPDQILLVGDSVANDVEGARAAGWQAVHLDRKSAAPHTTAITSLHELVNLL